MKTRTLLLSGAAVLLLSSNAQTDMTIDTFDAPPQSLTTTVCAVPSPSEGCPGPMDEDSGSSTPVDLTNIIGGYRFLKLESEWPETSGGGGDDASVTVDAANDNRLVVDNNSGVQSKVTVTWDADSSGLGGGAGVDLTEGDPNAAFYVVVRSMDGNTVNITVQLADVNGNSVSADETFASVSAPSPPACGTPWGTPLSDFTGDAGFDPTKVLSITMTIEPVLPPPVGQSPDYDGSICGVYTVATTTTTTTTTTTSTTSTTSTTAPTTTSTTTTTAPTTTSTTAPTSSTTTSTTQTTTTTKRQPNPVPDDGVESVPIGGGLALFGMALGLAGIGVWRLRGA